MPTKYTRPPAPHSKISSYRGKLCKNHFGIWGSLKYDLDQLHSNGSGPGKRENGLTLQPQALYCKIATIKAGAPESGCVDSSRLDNRCSGLLLTGCAARIPKGYVLYCAILPIEMWYTTSSCIEMAEGQSNPKLLLHLH